MKTAAELEKIGAAKRQFDQAALALDIEYRLKKEALKQGVFTAIAEALEAGHSVHAVAVRGMGYSSPGLTAMKSFTGAHSTSKENLLEAMRGITAAPAQVAAIIASGGAPEIYKWKEHINSGGVAKYTTYTLGGDPFEVIVRPAAPGWPATTDSQYESDKAEVGAILRSFTAHTNGKYTYTDEDQAILDSASTGQ